MKMSSLLLDDSGKRIEDWCYYFSVAPHPEHPEDAAKASVVHSFLIDGQLEDFRQTALADFVQIIEQPFGIDAVECLYLNGDSIYEDGMIEALARFTRTPAEVPVALVPILLTELAGAGLMLDRKTLNAFGRGQPIWRRGALSCASGRGEKGRSGASDLLLKAIRSWAIVSKESVRHAFRRANLEGTALDHRHPDINKSSRDLVEYFLGYYYSGALANTAVSEKNDVEIALPRFTFETIRREGRSLFPRPEASKTDRCERFFFDSTEIISRQIENDIKEFEVLNPGCRFDHYAIASWNLRVLLWLRLAYLFSTSMDAERSNNREQLRNAATLQDKDEIARRFSHGAYRAIKASRKLNGVPKGRLERVYISQLDLMGASETSLVAFLADIDPRSMRSQLYPCAPADQEALFGMARWLGQLYRHRQGYLTPLHAKLYFYLLERTSPLSGEVGTDEDTQELKAAVQMISSFITPVGLSRLEDAAAAAIADGTGRTIYAQDPDYYDTRGAIQVAVPSPAGATKSATARKFSIEFSRFDASAIPLPVLVPAGRLLIPGDYADEWFERCRDLMGVLQES